MNEKNKSYTRLHEYDKNQLDRITNLLKLQGICFYQQDLLMETCNIQPNTMLKSFFNHVIQVSDVLLTWQLFDELTASLDNRGGITDLKSYLCNNQIQKIIQNNPDLEMPLALAFRSIDGVLNVEYTDFLNGSQYQSFFVNVFSAFEYWTCKFFGAVSNDEEILNSKI